MPSKKLSEYATETALGANDFIPILKDVGGGVLENRKILAQNVGGGSTSPYYVGQPTGGFFSVNQVLGISRATSLSVNQQFYKVYCPEFDQPITAIAMHINTVATGARVRFGIFEITDTGFVSLFESASLTPTANAILAVSAPLTLLQSKKYALAIWVGTAAVGVLTNELTALSGVLFAKSPIAYAAALTDTVAYSATGAFNPAPLQNLIDGSISALNINFLLRVGS